MIALILLAAHWGPLALSAWLWPLRKLNFSILSALTVMITLPCCFIVLVCLLVFTDVSYTAQGNGMTWYMIYAVVSLGVVPAVIISAHIVAGRFVGYLARRIGRKHRKSMA